MKQAVISIASASEASTLSDEKLNRERLRRDPSSSATARAETSTPYAPGSGSIKWYVTLRVTTAVPLPDTVTSADVKDPRSMTRMTSNVSRSTDTGETAYPPPGADPHRDDDDDDDDDPVGSTATVRLESSSKVAAAYAASASRPTTVSCVLLNPPRSFRRSISHRAARCAFAKSPLSTSATHAYAVASTATGCGKPYSDRRESSSTSSSTSSPQRMVVPPSETTPKVIIRARASNASSHPLPTETHARVSARAATATAYALSSFDAFRATYVIVASTLAPSRPPSTIARRQYAASPKPAPDAPAISA